jgi:hypothetical protein
MRTLTYSFQFLIIAEFIRPFPLRQVFTDFGKYRKPVVPEKKPVDSFRVYLPQSCYGVKPTDR